jgi:hypothetical protein
MWKLGLALLALACAAWAANIKLYLTDGTYHLVREYQVQTDRVRYYSVERSDWEEIPLELVDLKRTKAEVAEHEESLAKEEKIVREENAAEAEVRNEASLVPQDPGAYWMDGKQVKALKLAEESVHTNKGRRILMTVLVPLPTNTKATLEIPGPHATTVFTDPEQEFYVQLQGTEAFGIAKLTTKGELRIVENLTYSPIVQDEVGEERTLVEYLHRQLGDGLYKIWPKDPLPPGEYAIVRYTDGKVDIESYDFAVKAK